MTKEYVFKNNKFTISQGGVHPGYSYFTFEEEEVEFRNKYWNVKNDDVVFDIGASYGSYSLTACAMGARVYSFEPETSVYVDLVNNIKINNWENRCSAFNIGLWDKLEQIDMRTYAPHWPAHTIADKFNMTTLDFFIKNYSIDKIDWMKIDVEGAEVNVVKGGIETIEKYKPNIIIECHNFLDFNIKNKIRSLLDSIYLFEEVDRDPCTMLVGIKK